jgi:integrase
VGVPGLRFHDLWHSAGTLSAVAGATTKELMARMGHSSPRAALIYQHATADATEPSLMLSIGSWPKLSRPRRGLSLP